jgi:two-component system, LuxR family, response regulator FixJ
MSEQSKSDVVRSVVHVVDDQQDVLVFASGVLRSVGLECFAWDSPEALLEACEKQRIDALVVDIRLQGMSGIELVRRLRDRGILAPVIFISGVNEVPVAIEAMKLGAYDFLPKPFTGQTLVDTVQGALRRYQGEVERGARANEVRALVAKLSPREKQVFLAVVDGKANKVIAFDLGLSEKTVEEHRSHVMTKLAASSVADLVKIAVFTGLVDPASVTMRA